MPKRPHQQIGGLLPISIKYCKSMGDGSSYEQNSWRHWCKSHGTRASLTSPLTTSPNFHFFSTNFRLIKNSAPVTGHKETQSNLEPFIFLDFSISVRFLKVFFSHFEIPFFIQNKPLPCNCQDPSRFRFQWWPATFRLSLPWWIFYSLSSCHISHMQMYSQPIH